MKLCTELSYNSRKSEQIGCRNHFDTKSKRQKAKSSVRIVPGKFVKDQVLPYPPSVARAQGTTYFLVEFIGIYLLFLGNEDCRLEFVAITGSSF